MTYCVTWADRLSPFSHSKQLYSERQCHFEPSKRERHHQHEQLVSLDYSFNDLDELPYRQRALVAGRKRFSACSRWHASVGT